MNKLWINLVKILDWIRRLLLGVIVLCYLLVGLSFDVPLTRDRDAMLDRVLGSRSFGLATWISNGILEKLGQEVNAVQDHMDEKQRIQFVRDTFKLIEEIQRADAEVRQIFLKHTDANTASTELRSKRDALRARLDQRRVLAEAIVQEQIESVLRDEGFEMAGQVLPPTRFRLTALPDVLIVSRRDRIERVDSRVLQPGLPVEELDTLEQQIDERFDVRSFVTPIGGLGAYPTMLPETNSIKFTVETGVHEWLHNYLMWRMAWVALRYLGDAKAQTINETTAIIVEQELSPKVFNRFYPELEKAEKEPGGQRLAAPAQQNKFNFRAEMRETRLRADELLEQKKVEEAEQYMETRRKLFVQNGYGIRKLNQAYFAFYGAYNAEPGGAPASGRDPIGPAVQELRKQSPTLRVFVERIVYINSVADLPSIK